jgi:catechol 2,3-dioxygenase-like lactoylglutathione lyase family enzyme
VRKYILGIDHAVILVRDLDRARDAYARLGFTLTPRGFHTLGSQNHCVMFERDYLELMAVPRPHPALAPFSEFLASGEGLGAIALATEDAAGARAELAAAGIPAEAPLDFSRPVTLPEGARDASFRIVQLPAARTPGCRAFLCEHLTREIVWRPEHQRHAVGAAGIAAIAVVADEPHGAAADYAALFGTRPRPIDEGLLVETAAAPIAVASRAKLGRRLDGVAMPARAKPFVAALFIKVGDRTHAADVLRRGGFRPVALKDGSWAVNAGDACGVTLVFG